MLKPALPDAFMGAGWVGGAGCFPPTRELTAVLRLTMAVLVVTIVLQVL